ncbi:universal stress protein UspE [Ferrimonas senticii]|uniref:universal stress protein UspE n=1 Tax=Ferrimonas senticii TaxID=394566 RepID=UPI0004048F8E|nr:universal stress protein UspE [Ferrimonas senticii]
MSAYNHILVVIDPSRETQPALTRVTQLCQAKEAQITLFMSIYDFSYEMTSMLSSEDRETLRSGVVKQRQLWLESLAQPLRQDGYAINIELAWHNRPFESIIKYALGHQVDLIVKASKLHDKLKSVIFTPTDWSLMRKAPVPVMLVKEQQWPTPAKILVAVNVGSEDDAHLTLNDELVRSAKTVASVNNAEIHLVNGYPGTPVNIAVELPDFDATAYNNTLKTHHQTRIHELAARHQLAEQNCHVAEGMPEDVIPDVAEDLNAEMVVIGTIGRTGLSAALIGNTAEHIIDSLNCDLMAVKPEDFVSPVTLD